MSSFVHTDIKGKDILIFVKGPTQGLSHTLTAETQYSINLTRPGIKFCLSLHYNGSNSFFFVNATKINQFKAKDSEIIKYPLCLGNISKYFVANNMKKNRIKWMSTNFLFIIIFLILVILILINSVCGD